MPADAALEPGAIQNLLDLMGIDPKGRIVIVERDGTLSGTATGLTDLDRLMGGLQQSDLIILAGRPGMGKTSLATNIAFNAAQRYQRDIDDGIDPAARAALTSALSHPSHVTRIDAASAIGLSGQAMFSPTVMTAFALENESGVRRALATAHRSR